MRCLRCGKAIAFFAEPNSTVAPRSKRLVYDPEPGQRYGKGHEWSGLCMSCRHELGHSVIHGKAS